MRSYLIFWASQNDVIISRFSMGKMGPCKIVLVTFSQKQSPNFVSGSHSKTAQLLRKMSRICSAPENCLLHWEPGTPPPCKHFGRKDSFVKVIHRKKIQKKREKGWLMKLFSLFQPLLLFIWYWYLRPY